MAEAVTGVLLHRRLWISSLILGGDRINSNQPAFERRNYLGLRWPLAASLARATGPTGRWPVTK